MTTSRSNGYLTLLLGAAFMAVMGGCGKTGMSVAGSRSDAGIAIGGSGGGESSVVGTSSQGGATPSAGSSSQAGASTGGASSLGGSKGSGGSSGGQTATVVQPTTHRPQALSCVGVYAPPEPVGRESGCAKHADCTQGSNGRCVTYSYGGGLYNFFCVYDLCATDADCEAGKVCHCSSQDSARCTSVGNCRVDANCGGGTSSACSLAYGADCAGHHSYAGYYCHTPKDTCLDDSDCTGKDYCDFDVIDGRWECKSPNMNCAIG